MGTRGIKILLSTVLILIPLRILADTQAFGGQFQGINNGDAPILIGDNEAQDASNVDITDNQYGIKTRDGYLQFRTIGVSTWGVRGGYYYTDLNGNKLLIHASSTTIYKSLNSGVYSSIVTTDTAGSYYDFTDSQGYLWRANSNRDEIFRYDGSNRTYYPSHPKGNQIEAMSDRLAISGTSANPNRVYFSQAADFTTFTTGLQDASAFTEDFSLPGQAINAIKYALGRLFAWTNTTTSFWSGSNQYDGQIKDVSTNVGCNQPDSILYDNSTIFWQAQDKHFYSFDGNAIRKISGKIAGSVENFVGGGINQEVQTTQASFELGSYNSKLTTSENPGFVSFPANGTVIDSFTDGNITSGPVWSTTMTSVVGGDEHITVTDGETTLAGGAGKIWEIVFYTTVSLDRGFAFSADIKSTGTNKSDLYVSISSSVPYLPNAFSTSIFGIGGITCALPSNSGSRPGVAIYKDRTELVRIATDTTRVDSTFKNFSIAYSTNGLIEFSKEGTVLVSTTNTDISTFGYISFGVSNEDTISNPVTMTFDNVRVKYSSAIFTSTQFNIGTGITSWTSFTDNSTTNGNSTLLYSLYGDSNTVINTEDATTFISSQTITNGSVPTIATAPYVVIKATFTRTASTESVSLDGIALTWNEGSITRTFGSIDKNHRLMWSLAENNSATNNATYIYDQRFDSWLKYSFPIDAPARVGDSIYFGGASTGVVYVYPYGTNDNGSAITAYWKTKDFVGNDPFVEKTYNTISLVSKTQSGSSLVVNAYLNGSATASKTFTVSLTNTLSLPFIRFNDRFSNGTAGTFINFKFGNTAADSPFEFYSARYDYTPKAWRVLP